MADLAFAPQHNMIAYLEKTKSNAKFYQIVNFLTSSSIHHSLTVSPTIYASNIEQFWNTATSQTINDKKQLHAIVDGKTIVIIESSVRRDILFTDANKITCLTNEQIFKNLLLMGCEGALNKLTFKKALFSPQWKFMIHTILHCLSLKTTSWNEFSTNIASTVIFLATNQNFNFSRFIFDGMWRNLDGSKKKFLMYPRFLQIFLENQIPDLLEPLNDVYVTPTLTKKVFSNMIRKSEKFSGTVTLLFTTMLAQPAVVEGEGGGDILVRAATTDSLDAQQDNINITKTQSKATLNEPTPHGEGSGSGPGRQKTMGGAMAQIRSEGALIQSIDPPLSIGYTVGSGEDMIEHDIELTDPVPQTPHDLPPSGGHTPGSDESSMTLKELTYLCTTLLQKVLDLENVKTAQAKEIAS
nr:hypothetical protein [Tanacetum cinerariifolium]